MTIKISMSSYVITKSGLKRVFDIKGSEEILGIGTNGKEKWAEVEINSTNKEDCYILYCDCFYGAFPSDVSIFTTNGQRKISTILNNYSNVKVECLSNISEQAQIDWTRGGIPPYLEAVMLRVKKIDITNNTIVLAMPTKCFMSEGYSKHIDRLCEQLNGIVLKSIQGHFWCWVAIKLHNKRNLINKTNNYKGHADWLSYYLGTAVDDNIDSIIEEDDIHSGLVFGLILKGMSYKVSYSPLYSPINISFKINESKRPYSTIKSICTKKGQYMGMLTTSQTNWYPIVNFIPIS